MGERCWVLYILQCRDGSLYTGVTNDLERRLAQHRAGTGARYTRGRGPLELIHQEACDGKSAALRREIVVKRLPRAAKLRMIAAAGTSRLAPAAPGPSDGSDAA